MIFSAFSNYEFSVRSIRACKLSKAFSEKQIAIQSLEAIPTISITVTRSSKLIIF